MENAVPATKHNAKIDTKAANKVAISPLLATQCKNHNKAPLHAV